MGSAAYSRGSTLIRRQLEAEQPSPWLALMDELSTLKRDMDAGLPWGPVRIICHGEQWWIQDAVKGDRGRGWWYASLRELCRHWQITLTEYDCQTGIFQAVPDKKPECQTLEAWLYGHGLRQSTVKERP